MWLLNRLFGPKANVTTPATRDVAAAPGPAQAASRELLEPFNDKFAHIRSLDFFGEFKRSPSGEWCILWSDSFSDEHGTRGGHRRRGHGRYVLYNQARQRVVLQGELERPNAGSVANNGSFTIEDWHFGDALSGTIYGLSSSGGPLLKKRFRANLYNSGISDSGRFAICQTAHADHHDGNKLTAFDLESKSILFSVVPATGWADSYLFDEISSRFGVILRSMGTFYYDAQGQLIDRQAFESAQLESGDYWTILRAAERLLSSPTLQDEDARRVVAATQRAVSLCADGDMRSKATALKTHGMAHEHLGNFAEAIVAYEGALKANPKIGVKRRVEALRKAGPKSDTMGA